MFDRIKLFVVVLSAILLVATGLPAGANLLDRDDEANLQVGDDPTLFVVACSHLDTQWQWSIQKTITEYLPNTLQGNFALFEEHPGYVFSFEGAFRYMLMKEYYPADYARVQDYVARGQWRPVGSAIDAGDSNMVSAESLLRHFLYGNGFFAQEFGVRSRDVFLPDCFGFSYALPSIAAHCGLRGFSTQKLAWGSAYGVPFDVGFWQGPDGAGLVAALNPGSYVQTIRDDLSSDAAWQATIARQREISGVPVGFKYFGVGDAGGAPDDESVTRLEDAMSADGPITVRSAAADALCRALTPGQVAALPRYRGPLLMTTHATGCYTSQAAMKRWNRKNELLADAAERAAVMADWLGGSVYPGDRLRGAWVRFLWHQFHDDLTGTSIPDAYRFSWNDELLSMNEFSQVLTNGIGGVTRALDTRVRRVPVVVYNPLAVAREDVVEAEVTLRRPADAVRVFDDQGRETPAQVLFAHGNRVRVAFVARLDPVAVAVYDVRPAEPRSRVATELRITPHGLENQRYRVEVNEAGDVSRIYDKQLDRELLAEPVRLSLQRVVSKSWPAWEIPYEYLAAEPETFVGDAGAEIEVVEVGPVRVALKITRRHGASTFIDYVRLSAGAAGDHVEWDSLVDWRTQRMLCKAVFPLAAANPKSTYDIGLGVYEYDVNSPQLYEVPAQQWVDVTQPDNSFGVTLMNDCKYGWDRPAENTTRLTLLFTPEAPEAFGYQQTQDQGFHRVRYGLAGHAGDWRDGAAGVRAARFNQPLYAFQTRRHEGVLGRRFSFVRTDHEAVAMVALKQAEVGDELIVRLMETQGRPARGVTVEFAAPLAAAREVNGAEEPLGAWELTDGRLCLDLQPYELRSFALRLERPRRVLDPPTQETVKLPYDRDVISYERNRYDGAIDEAGHSLPAELVPDTLTVQDIRFAMGPRTDGMANALVCRGQELGLPAAGYRELCLLATATQDTAGAFMVGDFPQEITVPCFTGFLGQWNPWNVLNSTIQGGFGPMPGPFYKPQPVAWVGTHRHHPEAGSEPYVFCYLFFYRLPLPPEADWVRVKLPDNDKIMILAASLSDGANAGVRPASAHVDAPLVAPTIGPAERVFMNATTVTLRDYRPGAQIVYTLDGREPAPTSMPYTGPIRLDATTTVKARAVVDGRLDPFSSVAEFTRAQPLPPATPAAVAPGLDYVYGGGKWDRMPDFGTLEIKARGNVANFDISGKKREEYFGYRFAGYLDVPADGLYTFYTDSDDGSLLFIDGREVVDNDGRHGPQEKAGTIALAAGLHEIVVEFFEYEGGDSLVVTYRGPELPKQPIPDRVLFRPAP